ncbi:hypothetical protein Q9L58_000433 [Maublancomyces gigas]|uniref:Uncharacterized protein n=1 Tax=Discina gigas TaxID=1032678 RepID=A0ABR3GXC9_9PEZI
MLLDLPNELLLQIVNHLGPETKHLNSFLRTTRFLHRILTPVLYKRALSVRDCNGRSLLRSASADDFVSLLQLLLDHGALATIDAKELASGTTSLQAAIMLRREAAVELLLKHGAGANTADEHGWTPLHWAALSGNCTIARLLIDKGARTDLKAYSEYGATALHFAAGMGKREMVRLLLDRGAGARVEDDRGASAIYYAMIAGERETAKLLLNHGDLELPSALDTNLLCRKTSEIHNRVLKMFWRVTVLEEEISVTYRSISVASSA